MSHRSHRLVAVVPAALLLSLALAGCSSGGSDSDAAATEDAASAERAPAEAGRGRAGGGASDSLRDGSAYAADGQVATLDLAEGALESAAQAPAEAPAPPEGGAQQPAIISTGTVSLRADDVGDARFEVQKVVDRAGGQVTDSETRTDDDGSVRDARLVLRVPSAEFTETVDALEQVADLEASSTTSEDVTTQVVDNAVRIRVQRESIARIETLLARAGSIRDVVAVERELTDREARLNSLLRQQAYLSDQTSMSTITVHLQRHPEDGGPQPVEDDGDGFLAGLAAGWDALSTVAVGAATATGAVLPFAVVALLVGVPLWWLARVVPGRRRRRVGPTAPAAPAEG